MGKGPAFAWRRRNTSPPEHVSTYPAEVWLIRRAVRRCGPTGKPAWALLRAAHDGDEYKIVGIHGTLNGAKKAAEDWVPE